MNEVSKKEMIIYGFGDFGSTIVFATVSSFLTFFYSDVVKISPATIGTVFFVSRLFDGIFDVFLGNLVDKTKSRIGQARVWMYLSALPLALSFIALFNIPQFLDERWKIVYLFVFYNLTSTVFYSLYTISHNTLPLLMTRDHKKISIMNINRITFGTIGTMIVSVVMIPSVTRFGGGLHGWGMTSVGIALVSFAVIIVTTRYTKERGELRSKNKKELNMIRNIRLLVKNELWIVLSLIGVSVYFIMGFSSVSVYYITYILGDEQLTTIFMIINYSSTILAMVVMMRIIKRISKLTLVKIGFILFVLGSIIQFFYPDTLVIFMAGVFIKGVGLAPLVGLLPSFIAESVEYGERKNGFRTEGLITSSTSIGQNLGTGLAAVFLGFALSLSNYVGGSPLQTASALMTIKGLYIIAPVVLYSITVVLFRFYKKVATI